jgi:multidrug efflux system outer membrane protein
MFVVMLIAAGVVTVGGRAAAAQGALDRVAEVQRAAVESSPELAAAQSEASLRGWEARSEAAAVNPYLEWQSEGLGPSRTPNAQDTLRLGTTFNFPGQIGPARRLAQAAERETMRARSALADGAAVEATRRWLELAAALERVAVRRARVEHLDLALNILEARHQLGEVAGVEVAQLDLEYSTASAQLDLARADAAALSHAVAVMCGRDFPPPEIGDLEDLVGGTSTPSGPHLETENLVSGAPMQVADAAAELEATRSEVAAATAWGRPLIEAEWEHFPEVEGLESFDAWGFRLSVPLPIGSVGKRQRAAARERAATATAVRDAALQESLRAARELLAEAEGASQQLQTLRPLIGDLDRIERSLSAQYRLGAITYLEYVYGTTRHDDVLLTTIDARRRLVAARLQLALLLDDPDLFPIVEPSPEEAS